MVERNWLIRTTQNQILGPVAKAKVLEFLQKGALGLNDEVTTGNGYWFSLKEKDLVDKYLYGDVPQGYNPISESKSVLSKREHPDKTTSLNTAPANKTQVIKLSSLGPGLLPPQNDLEFPDITVVNTNLTAAIPAASEGDMKLPTQDDLEFPNVEQITSKVENNPHMPVSEVAPVELKSKPKELVEAALSNEAIVYPDAGDLDYPDLAMPETKPEATADIKVETKPAKPAEKKSVSKDFKNEFEDDSGLTLVFKMPEEQVEKTPKAEPAISLMKKGEKVKDLAKDLHSEDKKLLHERKVKASLKEPIREITKDLPKDLPPRSMPEHLKKRNDNYLMYVLGILVLIILALFFYYYSSILNKPLPV